jgi:hypothetical protein
MKGLILATVLLSQVPLEKPKEPVSPERFVTAPEEFLLQQSWDNYLKRVYVSLKEDQRPRTENEWSDFFKDKYQAVREHSLFDGSRIDMLNSVYAIEVDSALNTNKWAEAVGQSIWYATNTNRKPAIILLVPLSPKARSTDDAETAEKRRSIKSNMHKAITVCQKTEIRLYFEEIFRYGDLSQTTLVNTSQSLDSIYKETGTIDSSLKLQTWLKPIPLPLVP